MKTPDEIKKGLECYIVQNTGGCENIPCRDCSHYNPNSAYTITACKDALAYIQQLERERDAAIDRCASADDVNADYYHEIKQLEAAQPKWISVEERLPDVVAESNWDKRTEYALAIEANGSFHVGRFYIFKFDGNYEFVSGYERPDVTHWMPLPEPPKEDA